jgi:hypothetical protein
LDDLLVEPGGGGGVGQAVTGDALALGAGGDHVGKGEKAMRLRARRVRLPRKVLRAVPVCRREGRCRLRKKRLGNLATLLVLLLGELLSIALGLLLLARAIWGGVTGRSVFALTCLISLAALCFDQIPLIDRVRNVSGDLSTSWRVDLIHDSLLQIIDRPWIGSAFVEMSSGLYAHTILLDAPMAIGLPLASVLLFIVLFAVRWALRMLSGPDSVFGLLYLQAVLGAVFSGALYGAALFWTTITIVLALGARANAALLRKQCGRDHRLWMKPFDSAKPIR